MSKHIFVFFLSAAAAIVLLVLERLAGIGWDYHVDSITYATNSFETVAAILEQGIQAIPNNGYYFICAFLGQNVVAITTYNIIVYSITNILISDIHWNSMCHRKKLITLPLLLMLLNPYRAHLATTLLKDTTVLLLIVMFIYNARRLWISMLPLILIRFATLIYLIALVPRKYFKYLILLFFVSLLVFPDIYTTQLDDSSTVDLHIRDFDTIPTFQAYGYIGSIVRGVVWPLLAITGSFVLISPAFAFIFVSIGCIMNMLYTWLMMRKMPISINILTPMFIFAILAPGFTSYIRYIYPLIVIAPLLMVKDWRQIRHF